MAVVSTSDKHLKLRGSVYWYTRGVPKDLAHQYTTKRIEKSLDTSDVRVARALRDRINADLSLHDVSPRVKQLRDFRDHMKVLEPQRDRNGILEHSVDLDELKANKEDVLHDVLMAQHNPSISDVNYLGRSASINLAGFLV